MEGIVLGPGTRPRPQFWPDMTANESEQHALDWKAVLKGATISAVSWVSLPAGLVFTGSTISGNKTTITIAPPAQTADRDYLVQVKMTDSGGQVHEINPAIRLMVRTGGTF
jgi:hypothetical protein